MTPLLFLDVDGPLIPFGEVVAEYSTADLPNSLLARVNPARPGGPSCGSTTRSRTAIECG